MSDYQRFRAELAAAIDGKLYSVEYLDALLAQGHAKLWTTDRSAIVAAIKRYPTGLYDIAGMCAAGDLEEITGVLIPQAEAFGREIGCAGALIESREGWARQLRPLGYRLHQTTVRKDFSE